MSEVDEIAVGEDQGEAGLQGRNYRLLADIPLRLSVEVGSTALKLSELMNLAEGGDVELDRQEHEMLAIMANVTLSAKVEVVPVTGRRSVRVVDEIGRAEW